MDKPTFVDGFGHRLSFRGPDGERLESLRLSGDMGNGAQVEAALVERATAFSLFHHPGVARFCRIERTSGAAGTITLTSAGVPGIRLSEVLRHAERRVIDPDPNAVWSIVQQVVSAVAAMHAHSREVSHGAVAPERVVVQQDGSVLVAEYILGSALEQLQLSRSQLWSLFHVAVPPTAGSPRLDQQADVLQVGVLTLALLLGRMLRREEFPGRVGDLLAEVAATDPRGHRPPLSRALHSWVARALQLDARCAFRTAIDAESALTAALAQETCTPSIEAVAQYAARASGELPIGRPVQPIMPVARPSAPSTPAMSERPFPPRSGSGARVLVAPKAWSPLARATRLSMLILGLVLLWGATYLGARAYLRPTPPPGTGTVSIESRPGGISILVDGEPRGRTPLTLELPAGAHTLSLQTARGTTIVPVKVEAGARKVERIDLRSPRVRR